MMVNPNYKKPTKCKYCGENITFSLKTPYNNSNGEIHECEEYRESRKNAKVSLRGIDPEVLAQYEKSMNEHVKSKKYSVRKPSYVIQAS